MDIHTDNVELQNPVLLNKLFNYMKIAEMEKYGIQFFENMLHMKKHELDELDFVHLAASYWCNVDHFRCLISKRGMVIKQSTLQLKITKQLLNLVVDSGANLDKIKIMLKQRRKDLNYDWKKIQELEKEFFCGNCRRKFWNYELPIRAFYENGWLSREYAQIGLNRFTQYMFDRIQSCTDTPQTKTKWANLTEVLTISGASLKSTKLSKLPIIVCLHYSRGINSYKFKKKSTSDKNEMLYSCIEIKLPADLWNGILSFI